LARESTGNPPATIRFEYTGYRIVVTSDDSLVVDVL